MCMNRPIAGSPFFGATDMPPGIPREEAWVDDEIDTRLPLRFRALGFALSRIEFVHRELREFYQTRYGFVLVWANIILWGLYAATRIFGIQ